MEAVEWSDYVCPWCYLALDRVALLEDLGVGVTCLPFELHPDTPVEGRPVRPGGRLSTHLERIGAECREAGLAFRLPQRVPNSRRALATAEWVRRNEPHAFGRVHRALFAANFADGLDIGDADVLDAIVDGAGADAPSARAAVESGRADAGLDESLALAREHGVAGTPAWLLDGSLLVPGVQPREVMERWVRRMQARADR